MHRATPLNTSMRAYCGGGARSVVDQVDDTKFMQEMAGNFMYNETRQGIEAAQNYGFSSVVFDAEKDGQGKIQASAECFMSFIGGNRSFPAAGPMDDRRHRMYKLEKGDTAMFRGRGDKQQFHMTQDGGFWTAPLDKTVRMQMLETNSETNSTMQQGGGQGGGGGGGAQTRDASGGSGGGSSGQQGGQQNKGQSAVYKDGQKSYRFVDVTKDATRLSGNEAHLMLSDGDSYVHCVSQKTYLGGNAGKHSFDKLVTLSGPTVNCYGRIG